jgi:hypothetical protein
VSSCLRCLRTKTGNAFSALRSFASQGHLVGTVTGPAKGRALSILTKPRDELAPPHSITSSARASSMGGTSRPSAFAAQKRTFPNRRFVPFADSCAATNDVCSSRSTTHSTTSSALISIAAGIVRPSISKVFLLMTRRKWVGCSNGRSAGRAPLKIRSARPAARS